MYYIEHFVINRLAHAKEILSELDPNYVCMVESLAQSQSLKGKTLTEEIVKEFPRKRLNQGWHRLLESCTELYMQSRRLFITERWLDSTKYTGLSDKVAGVRFYCSSHLWFIHAFHLSERIQDVISKATRVYVKCSQQRIRLNNHYSNEVNEQIANWVECARHMFAHGNEGSSTQGITEDELWELGVVTGNTARKVIELYTHPARGRDMKQGKYSFIFAAATLIWSRIDTILQDLERDLLAIRN